MLLWSAPALAQPPASAIKIVVIEGEAAVNIIQQRTAVRPVVEVRDRNDLPVAGALVTFTIEGGKAATFGGASTLTITTNVAGRAVASLTPTTAGAFHIQVSAAFQGQVATAAIAQTNVMTAATAAGAAAASGGGSASAGGGAAAVSGGASGLSFATIGIAAGAVAGGAVVAVATGLIGPVPHEEFTGTFSGAFQAAYDSASSACVYSYAVTGTAQLVLDPNKDEQLFRFSISAPVVTTAICDFAPVNSPRGGTINLTGTAASYSGRSGDARETISVQVAVSGSSATAQLTVEEQDSNARGRSSAKAVFAMNLQKTP